METIKIKSNNEEIDLIIHEDNEIDYVDIDLDKTVNISIIKEDNNEED